jgi:hypothetical protein
VRTEMTWDDAMNCWVVAESSGATTEPQLPTGGDGG